MLPILYSFRRCPYAIRARMTLQYSGVAVELREVVLRDKPPGMLAASAKGTVPVLVLADGTVLEESYDIMRWALSINDPDSWWRNELAADTGRLIEENDFSFKTHLDHYKYADRYPVFSREEYRRRGEVSLQLLEARLEASLFLMGEQLTFADVAIFPFVRQFAFVDKHWFDAAPYPNLQRWLTGFLDGALFLNVMRKYPQWQESAPATVFSGP